MSQTSVPQPYAESYLREGRSPLPWSEAAQRLATAGTVWLATTTPAGRPHVVPVLSVWAAGAPHVAASPASRKARNLANDSHCIITAREDGLDLVIEGMARRVTDASRLRSVADAYAEQHGWLVEIGDGALHGEGAPTAGPPPYDVYEIIPTRAFAFPQDGRSEPTRWRFEPGVSR